MLRFYSWLKKKQLLNYDSEIKFLRFIIKIKLWEKNFKIKNIFRFYFFKAEAYGISLIETKYAWST